MLSKIEKYRLLQRCYEDVSKSRRFRLNIKDVLQLYFNNITIVLKW